jgi:protein translocase SecG subunit
MKTTLLLIQIVVAIAMSVLILIQAKGTGLGRAFGGQSTYHSKRGVEFVVFRFTVILAVIFVAISIANQML